jgi:hypothetical protein
VLWDFHQCFWTLLDVLDFCSVFWMFVQCFGIMLDVFGFASVVGFCSVFCCFV